MLDSRECLKTLAYDFLIYAYLHCGEISGESIALIVLSHL